MLYLMFGTVKYQTGLFGLKISTSFPVKVDEGTGDILVNVSVGIKDRRGVKKLMILNDIIVDMKSISTSI